MICGPQASKELRGRRIWIAHTADHLFLGHVDAFCASHVAVVHETMRDVSHVSYFHSLVQRAAASVKKRRSDLSANTVHQDRPLLASPRTFELIPGALFFNDKK